MPERVSGSELECSPQFREIVRILELPGWTERSDGQKLSAEAKATGTRRERAAMEALA